MFIQGTINVYTLWLSEVCDIYSFHHSSQNPFNWFNCHDKKKGEKGKILIILQCIPQSVVLGGKGLHFSLPSNLWVKVGHCSLWSESSLFCTPHPEWRKTIIMHQALKKVGVSFLWPLYWCPSWERVGIWVKQYARQLNPFLLSKCMCAECKSPIVCPSSLAVATVYLEKAAWHYFFPTYMCIYS